MAIRKDILEKHKQLPVLQRYELIDRINLLDNIRDQALVAFLYLSACRVSEVCQYYTKENDKRILKGYSIQKKQLEIEDGVLKIFNVRTLKRRRTMFKTIPIIICKERKLYSILKTYLDTLGPEDYLFPITRQRAYQILGKVELFNHYLRHLRLTHLVTDYNFSSMELKQFVNWGNSKSADSYIHLNVDNLINKMQRG